VKDRLGLKIGVNEPCEEEEVEDCEIDECGVEWEVDE